MRYLICVVALLWASTAAAQESPWALRMLPSDDSWLWSWAVDINEAGHVCGTFQVDSESASAVLWKDGAWIDVSDAYGMPDGYVDSSSGALNDSGLLGGDVRVGGWGDPDRAIVATVWDTVQGTVEVLHQESLGFRFSWVSDLNNSGLVLMNVFDGWDHGDLGRGYVWDTNTGTGRLLPVTVELPSGAAVHMNEAGEVAGWVQNDQWVDVSHAAVWLQDGIVRDLHEEIRAHAPAVVWSRAFGINSRSEVVGLGWDETWSESWAWTWSQDGGIVLLDRASKEISLGTGITEQLVTGYSGDWPNMKGIVWIDGIRHELPGIPGYNQLYASLANSSGVICGEARSSTLKNGAFVAEPRDTGDYDGDALEDKWELQGYDHDNGSHVDLPSMGANPLRRDLFVEIDAMAGHRPDVETLQPVIDAFKAHDIALHVHIDEDLPFDAELGTLDGLERYQWEEFDALKSAHFAEELESAVRYCVFGHRLATLTDSGLARGEPSSDFIVSLGAFVEESGSTDPWMQAGTFMHELGHTLGLQHGGGDPTNRKPNYLSVMNYDFQKQGLRIGGQDGNFDYSPVLLAALNETALDESAGLGAPAAGFQTLYRIVTIDPLTFDEVVVAVWSGDAQGSIDWDGDTLIDAAPVSADINADGTKGDLTGHDDWAALDFNGGTVGFGVGLPTPEPPAETEAVEELTVEEAKVIPPPPVEGLAARAGRRGVRLSWTPVGPYGQGTYRVYRWSGPDDRVLVKETQASLTSDNPGSGTWNYVVTVVDSVGAESLDSEALRVRVR